MNNSTQPRTAPTVALAFAVFSAGYFLSYAMRAVNAALSPDLRAELSLSSEALGWLTSAYLVAFAALQLPLGVWLDKYGARRVESVLLLIAAAGCAVFASSHNYTMLFIGRALIGLGVSACLMAAFTSFRQWYDPSLMSRLAAWMLVVGTSGALVATVPVRMLADAYSWRVVFVLAGVAFVLVAVAMWTLFPKQAVVQADTNAVKVGYGAIFNRQAIRATLPIAFFGQGGFIALQTLWAAPWLIQVLAQTKEQAASSLFIMNSTLVCIYIVIGTFASKLSLKTERLAILASLSISSFALLLMTIWQAPLSWILLPVMADDSSRRAIQNAFSLVYGLKLPSEIYASYAFATKLKAAGRPLPKVHLIAKNRLTQYMGAASAYAAVLTAIQHDIEALLKSNKEIFTFKDSATGFVEIRDFQTTGVVAFAKGMPFSKLPVGKQTINGHRVQVKQEYLDNSIKSIELLVSKL